MYICPKCAGDLSRYKTADKDVKKAYKCKNCGQVMYKKDLLKKV
jgi:predicted RNA-binding Zn-ribbon protein involved in translation (DUF1610 family)